MELAVRTARNLMAKVIQLIDNTPQQSDNPSQQPRNPPQQIYAFQFNRRQLLRTNRNSFAADFSVQCLQLDFAALLNRLR
jgi:hypothetical protein